MKNFTFTILSVLAMFISACKKDAKEPEKEFYLTANRNKEIWLSSGGTYIQSPADEFNFSGGKNNEYLSINLTFNSQGQLVWSSPKTTLDVIEASDYVKIRYILDENAMNEVNITSYDKGTEIITGTFKLSFKISNPDIKYDPATIVFTNGRFRLKRYDYLGK